MTDEMPEYFPRGDLDALALHHGTDKASSNHDYMRFYEYFLGRFRNEEFVLLELGVGLKHNKGKSLLTWRDYFPRARIVGVDIRPDAKEVETDRSGRKGFESANRGDGILYVYGASREAARHSIAEIGTPGLSER